MEFTEWKIIEWISDPNLLHRMVLCNITLVTNNFFLIFNLSNYQSTLAISSLSIWKFRTEFEIKFSLAFKIAIL